MPNETQDSTENRNAIWQQRYATLREARQRFAVSQADQAQTSAHRYVIVRSGNKRFAFPLRRVGEVLTLDARQVGTPVPGAPPSFWGLLLVRGEVRPVFDIKQLLGVSAEDTDTGEHILFVQEQEGEALVGLKTDRVEQIETLPEVQAEETVPMPGRFITRLHQSDDAGTPIQIVDISALLASLRGDAEVEHPFALSERSDPRVLTDDSAPASVVEE